MSKDNGLFSIPQSPIVSDIDQLTKVPSLSASLSQLASSRESSRRSNGSDSARWRAPATNGSDGLLSRPLDSKRNGAGVSAGGFSGVGGVSASAAAGRIEDTLRGEVSGDALLRRLGASKEDLADALLIGAENGDEHAVDQSLKAGVDPNQVSGRNGFTPLHHASARGHFSIVKLLLGKGASVFASTSDGLETPLHMAAYHGHLDICELLLSYHSDLNCKSADGESPLFFASRRSRAEIVALLLSRGADVDMLNRYGDRAVDDATDDDTIHQFLLHEKQRKEGQKMSSSGSGDLTSVLKREASLSAVEKTPTLDDLFLTREYASRMRASNLKRCLRYLRKQELICAALTCYHWREAASDSRLWKPFGGLKLKGKKQAKSKTSK